MDGVGGRTNVAFPVMSCGCMHSRPKSGEEGGEKGRHNLILCGTNSYNTIHHSYSHNRKIRNALWLTSIGR